MNARSGLILAASIMAVFGMGLASDGIWAQAENSVITTPLNEEISIQSTTTVMTVPSDNTLPWGTVRGAPSDYVERYPVIIQFYQNDDPVHFAQVDVKGDGSYEYRFRVGSLNYETGIFENFFEGDYTVKIFKVVPNTDKTV